MKRAPLPAVLLAAVLASCLAAASAGAAAADLDAPLRPFEGTWTGAVSCGSGEGKLALVLRLGHGAPFLHYLLTVKSGKREGRAELLGGQPRTFRVKMPDGSFLLRFEPDGKRLALLTDPQAEGAAALARLSGGGRVDSKRRKVELNWTLSAAPGVPPALLAAARLPSRDDCKATLSRDAKAAPARGR